MFEKARAIAKRRAEVDPDKYNEWLTLNGYLPAGRDCPTPLCERALSAPHETTFLGGQLDPEELKEVYESLTHHD